MEGDIPTQLEVFEAEVKRLQPSVRSRDISAGRAAARIAAQHSDVAPRIPARTSTHTHGGCQAGASGEKERKMIMERWKVAFATKMDNLNWEVYSIEHLSEELYAKSHMRDGTHT